MTTNIAIVNSSVIQQSRTRDVIEEYRKKRGADMHVDYYLSGVELLNCVRECGGYEIYIIDVVISEMDGVTIAEKIRASGDRGKILLLNGDASHAWKAFKVRVSNYLLWPLNREDFCNEMDLIFEELGESRVSPVIEIKIGKGIRRARLKDLVYAEVESRIINYFFADGNVHKSGYLRKAFCNEVEYLLEYEGVILAGQSLLLNLEHVKMIDSEGILLSTGETINPPKYLRKIIDGRWNEFLLGKTEAGTERSATY